MPIRSLRENDADSMLQLWNRSCVFDPITAALLREKIWEDPDFKPDLTLAAEAGGALNGFATAVARNENQRGFIKLIATDVHAQRQGIGCSLLQALEERLSTYHVTSIRVGESAPNYLVPGLDRRYTSAQNFFTKNGYRNIGETRNLRVDLEQDILFQDDTAARLGMMGIDVRRALASDHQAVLDFVQLHWPSWQAEVTCSMQQQKIALHIALRDGDILGFAAYDGNNTDTGWFGPMGTLESARGLGVGQVLMHHCLADIKAQGHSSAVIPWVGPVGFYERHAGAVPDREFIRLEKVTV